MKGKIDKNGFLYIERSNGVYKQQYCPDSRNANGIDCGYVGCGDWCTLFGEPENEISFVNLPVCTTVLSFKRFSDERKDPNNYEIEFNADLVQEICKRYWDIQERIEIIENIAKQIDSSEYESPYTKKADQFAKYTINIMQETKEILENLENDVIEFDNNGDE